MLYLIGADEVGRGCLAGDVTVGAVAVPQNMRAIAGVDDSKKLSPAARERAYGVLTTTAGVHYRLASRTAQDIDERGIVRCLEECFSEAIQGLLDLDIEVGRVWVDGEPIKLDIRSPVKVKFVPHGDAEDWVIGAASIIAKVSRDAYMVKMADEYPGYGWGRNKGYGTAEHTKGIRLRGLTPLHRKFFCRKLEPEPEIDVFSLFSGED